MMTAEEHALLIDIQDQLIELYVHQSEAKSAQELGTLCELQIEINELETQRDELRALDAVKMV